MLLYHFLRQYVIILRKFSRLLIYAALKGKIMYRTLLFDLDGTLTDSAEGITKCVQYALASQKIQVTDLTELRKFIGPPLRASMEKFYGLTPQQSAAALQKYRERFVSVGMYENRAYAGILELLQELAARGSTLAMATGKPEIYALPIARRFGFAPYLQAICGSTLDGRLDDKALVVRNALARLRIATPEQKKVTALIGDRRDDVLAAHANGIACIAVGYGFGSYAELHEAGADHYAADIAALRKLLLDAQNAGTCA